MALESASFISGLVSANPPGTDAISQGDDHLRLIKTVLKASLPNADEAINGIHTKATEPSSTSAGLIWFDTTDKLIKIRNEANDAWIILLAYEGNSLLRISHAICAASGYIREDSYYDTGFTITHTKISATSDLYVNVNFYSNYASNFNTGSFQAYLQLTNSSGTIITGTTANLQYIHLDDLEIGSNPTADFSIGYSRWFKVTAANCPAGSGTTGAQTFDIYTKLTAAAKADGGVIVGPGTMMVMEIE
jgi:hypothetical protein